MNKLFEKNTVMQVVIILATLALLWVRPMFSPEPMPAPDGYAPLYSLVYNLSMPPVVAMVAASVPHRTLGKTAREQAYFAFFRGGRPGSRGNTRKHRSTMFRVSPQRP